MIKKSIFVFDAEPGMVLASDVLAQDGSLVIPRGTALDMNSITKLSDYHILEIDILDRPVAKPAEPVSEGSEEQLTYYAKVRETPRFKEFVQDYDLGVTELKGGLNDIAEKHMPVDEDKLIEHTQSIIGKFTNKLQLFDMLHSLRESDDLTYAHSVNVALVSSIIGQWLHYSDDDIRVLTLCGLLHDVGKVKIPNEILTKPGKLTDEEFATMKTHVTEGYEILKGQNIDNRIKEACLFHHEKCDGSGYPHGLKSDKIPVFAKIVSVADIYDAMTANRYYRKALCPFTVVEMMERQCFSSLDPTYALPFLKNVVSSYIHNNVRLSDGRMGEVILINDRSLSKPSVLCNGEFIDLSKSNITIEAIL
jgi:putative nucleotidyltransferase with HDIG domain